MMKDEPDFEGLVFDNFSIKAFGDLNQDPSENKGGSESKGTSENKAASDNKVKYDITVSPNVEGSLNNYSITYKSNVSFNGKKVKPEVKIIAIDKTTGAKKELTPKKDYKVKYGNNKDAGELKGKA